MVRLTWQRATTVSIRKETGTACTLTLDVEGWAGHLPGQHLDLRLTAPDGYSAVRPYSMVTPSEGSRVSITVQQVDDGEVSSFLVRAARVGTELDVRGPLGGWFVWDKLDPAPIQLLGGGVGVGPLMAMLRDHDRTTDRHPLRLLYFTRDPETVIFADELARRAASVDPTTIINVLFTRQAPDTAARPAGRISSSDLASYGLPVSPQARNFVCGPTGFVEASIDLLIKAGYNGDAIRAERFG